MSLDSRALELQFLPAALEIEETPPLPLARVMLWSIVVFFLLALAWACIGRVDIVGVAPGKSVPSGRTKTIQPLENAVVAAIRVADGQHVKAGEVLVELDPTLPAADRDRLTQERMTLALDRARLDALLNEAPSLTPALLPPDVDDLSLAQYQASLLAQRHEYAASLQALHEARREKEAAKAGVRARIAQLAATLPLITEEAGSYKTLLATGMVPRVKWLELERARIEQQQELAVQRQQQRELEAGLDALDERVKATAAQYRSKWTTELTEVEARLRRGWTPTTKRLPRRSGGWL